MRRFRFLQLLIVLAASGQLRAHSIFQNSLWVDYTEKQMDVRVQVTVKEICTAAGLDFDPKQLNHTEIERAAPKHLPYLLSHLQIESNGVQLVGALQRIEPPESWEPTPADKDPNLPAADDTMDRLHFFFHLVYPCPQPPKRISLKQSMMTEFSYTPGTPFNFSYLVRVARSGKPAQDFGPLAEWSTFQVATDFEVAADGTVANSSDKALWPSMRRFLQSGFVHVLEGYDHLLFAAALVLALSSFWEVFKIIALFTLAHSITVTLTSYQLISVSPSIVEPLIAGSIVFVALENLFFPAQSKGWRRMVLTFGFGLIHGMGLAGQLVPNLEGFTVGIIALAILAFCIGVEIGHLCIIAPFCAVTRVVPRPPAMRYGSILIALAGGYYLLKALDWLPGN